MALPLSTAMGAWQTRTERCRGTTSHYCKCNANKKPKNTPGAVFSNSARLRDAGLAPAGLFLGDSAKRLPASA